MTPVGGPPPAPVPLYPAPLVVRNNGLAIAALVCGLFWFTWIGAVLAVVFGHVARRRIRAARGWLRGGGMALAGMVLGYSGLALLGFAIIGSATGRFQ